MSVDKEEEKKRKSLIFQIKKSGRRGSRQGDWEGITRKDGKKLRENGILETKWRTFIKKVNACSVAQLLIRVWLFATPWTVARQAPLSVGLSRQAYWSGLPFSSLGDLPDSGIEHMSPVSPALQVDSFITEPPGKEEEWSNVPNDPNRSSQMRIENWPSYLRSWRSLATSRRLVRRKSD